MLFWFFVCLGSNFSNVAITPTFEDSELHYSLTADKDLQKEKGNSFPLLLIKIVSTPNSYLKQKEDTPHLIYSFKYDSQITDAQRSFILYQKFEDAIGLRLASHSISYPFHTFL